ncbi:hypothetical protein ABZ192_42495 [Streptomyces sp. NPDC006235]|uniref:hypothetical protein n=1 Tax=Streptomyces sp. NPDC006235 TaxID=3156736 RepID=UPI0033ADD9EB
MPTAISRGEVATQDAGLAAGGGEHCGERQGHQAHRGGQERCPGHRVLGLDVDQHRTGVHAGVDHRLLQGVGLLVGDTGDHDRSACLDRQVERGRGGAQHDAVGAGAPFGRAHVEGRGRQGGGAAQHLVALADGEAQARVRPDGGVGGV